MTDIKFTLLRENSHYEIGVTDMKNHINRPLYAGGCTIWVCNSGMAIVSINFRKQLLRAGDVLFLFSDMVFIVVRTSSTFSAFYTTVSSELLNEATYNISWVFYEFLYANPICKTSIDEYEQLVLWQQQLTWFVADNQLNQHYSFVRNAIQNLFLGVDREIKRNPDVLKQAQRKDRAWVVLKQFFALLLEHCYQSRSVSFYAEKLCITPYYLYKITDKIMNLSPKEIIDEQIVVEIKMHLTYTNMTINEIAEKLNFDDPSYMCRFFKRYTGKSLTDYRAEPI